MKHKGMIACILCVALMGALLAGCGGQEDNPAANAVPTNPTEQTAPTDGAVQEQTQPQETAPAETEAPTDPTEPSIPVIPDNIVVMTPYGYLQYRDQWAEFMKTEQQVEGDAVSVFFTAVINEVEYALFTITIGGEGEGPICQMTDAAGVARDVFVHVEEIENTSALTEDEQNRLYAMQEEINYVIENIK